MPVTAIDAQEVVQAIMDRSILDDWIAYAIIFLLSIAGAFLGSYFKRRGEHFATKADFEEILDQVCKSTRASEGIRAEIESRYGEAAALRNIARDRLELSVMATFDLELWMEEKENQAIAGQMFNVGDSPFSKIAALQSIYFPELYAEGLHLEMALRDYFMALFDVRKKAMEWVARQYAGDSGDPLQILINDALAINSEKRLEVKKANQVFRSRLIEVGRARGWLPPLPVGRDV